MSAKEQKQILEEKRKRMKSIGRDLDIVDKVRLQRTQKKSDDHRNKEAIKLKGYQTRRTRGGPKQKRR